MKDEIFQRRRSRSCSGSELRREGPHIAKEGRQCHEQVLYFYGEVDDLPAAKWKAWKIPIQNLKGKIIKILHYITLLYTLLFF